MGGAEKETFQVKSTAMARMIAEASTLRAVAEENLAHSQSTLAVARSMRAELAGSCGIGRAT
jgi:hypothetical protein